MRPHFSLFGIPVFVRPSFFVIVAMLAASQDRSVQAVLVWVAVAFVGVLMHELGHAFMGRAFGLQPVIQLVGMGGLTSWAGGRNVGPGKSLLISIAGPAVGIAIGVLALGYQIMHPTAPESPQGFLLNTVVWINLGWGLINLAPIMPLDGGNAMRAVFGIIGIGDAELLARGASVLVGLGLGLFSISTGYLWGVMLVVMYTFQNVQGFRTRLATRGDESVLKELQTGYPQWLARGDGAAMLQAAARARSVAKTPGLVAFATEVAAMGQCLSGDPSSALATLQAMPQGFAPGPSVLLHVLVAAREYAGAKQLLGVLLSKQDSPELRAKLAEIEALERRYVRGRALLVDPSDPSLDAAAFHAARDVADAERRWAESARVGAALFERSKDADLAFQIAREWGKAREPEKVAEWLTVAAELGFRDVAQIDHCPDFYAIQASSPFLAGRAKVAENA